MTLSKEYLEEKYQQYNLLSDIKSKIQCITTIIEIKNNNSNLSNTKRSLYLDIKELLKLYITNRSNEDYGYDKLDNKFIIDEIEKNKLSYRQQLSLYQIASILLHQVGIETSWIDKRMLEIRLKIFKQENIIKYLIVLSGKSKLNCIVTLVLLFTIECIGLLPIAESNVALFRMDYMHFSDNILINHIINVWSLRLNWTETPKLHCLTTIGIILITFWHIMYIVFVANIIFKNLFDNIDINDIPE